MGRQRRYNELASREQRVAVMQSDQYMSKLCLIPADLTVYDPAQTLECNWTSNPGSGSTSRALWRLSLWHPGYYVLCLQLKLLTGDIRSQVNSHRCGLQRHNHGRSYLAAGRPPLLIGTPHLLTPIFVSLEGSKFDAGTSSNLTVLNSSGLTLSIAGSGRSVPQLLGRTAGAIELCASFPQTWPGNVTCGRAEEAPNSKPRLGRWSTLFLFPCGT